MNSGDILESVNAHGMEKHIEKMGGVCLQTAGRWPL